MWERRDGGYLIVADDMLKVAIDFNEKTDRLEAECAQRGGHLPSDGDDESGWVTCSHCTIPLKRPDGGPVALPGGGLPGPDPLSESTREAEGSGSGDREHGRTWVRSIEAHSRPAPTGRRRTGGLTEAEREQAVGRWGLLRAHLEDDAPWPEWRPKGTSPSERCTGGWPLTATAASPRWHAAPVRTGAPGRCPRTWNC